MRRALFALVGMLAGCSALLGIETGSFEPPLDGGVDDAKSPPREGGLLEDGGLDPTGDASVVDPGPCADTQTNPRHCGACGHDCLAGLCDEGLCLAGRFVLDDANIRWMEASATHLFWSTEDGRLRRKALAGGPTETIFIGSAPEALGFNFVVADDGVYFVDKPGQRIARCPLTGPCTPTTVIASIAKPFVVAEAGGRIYAPELFGTTIYRCTRPCPTSEVFVTGETRIFQLAAKGEHVVWTTLSTSSAATVRAAKSIAPAPKTIFERPGAGLYGTTAVVVDSGGKVFFVYLGDLFTTDVQTPAAEKVLVPDVSVTDSLVLRDGRLWWTDPSSGAVHSRPLSVPDGSPGFVIEAMTSPPNTCVVPLPNALYYGSGKSIWVLAR